VTFQQARERAMERLESDRSQGRVDPKAEPMLRALNDHPDHYTTSSCAGRVQLISVVAPGDKRSSHRWGIWHDAPTLDLVEAALTRWREATGGEQVLAADGTAEEATELTADEGTEELLYLQAQSPIFHVACHGLEPACRLRALAVNCGWKYSSLRGFKGVDPLDGEDWDTVKDGTVIDGTEIEDTRGSRPRRRLNRVMVELLCSERMDTPLAHGRKLYVHGPALAFCVEVARVTLEQTQARLPRLLEALDQLK